MRSQGQRRRSCTVAAGSRPLWTKATSCRGASCKRAAPASVSIPAAAKPGVPRPTFSPMGHPILCYNVTTRFTHCGANQHGSFLLDERELGQVTSRFTHFDVYKFRSSADPWTPKRIDVFVQKRQKSGSRPGLGPGRVTMWPSLVYLFVYFVRETKHFSFDRDGGLGVVGNTFLPYFPH